MSRKVKMSLEQKINYQLNKVPGVKKAVKRVYQRTMYAISPKIKSEGNIVRIGWQMAEMCLV